MDVIKEFKNIIAEFNDKKDRELEELESKHEFEIFQIKINLKKKLVELAKNGPLKLYRVTNKDGQNFNTKSEVLEYELTYKKVFGSEDSITWSHNGLPFVWNTIANIRELYFDKDEAIAECDMLNNERISSMQYIIQTLKE